MNIRFGSSRNQHAPVMEIRPLLLLNFVGWEAEPAVVVVASLSRLLVEKFEVRHTFSCPQSRLLPSQHVMFIKVLCFL